MVEIHPEEIEAMRRKYGDPGSMPALGPMQDSPPNSLANHVRDYNRNHPPMTTFSAKSLNQLGKMNNNPNNNNNKRNSYSPAEGRHHLQHRPNSGPIDQFLENTKFQVSQLA